MRISSNGIYFGKNNFGECKIIAMIDNNVLIESQMKSEPYVIGVNFDFETKEWSWGHYFKDKETALKYFAENYINENIKSLECDFDENHKEEEEIESE